MPIPVISIFHGVVVHLHILSKTWGHLPHVYARYGSYKASVSILDGEVLSGTLPSKQLYLIQTWLRKYKTDLLSNWDSAKQGSIPFRIEPL